MLMTYWDQKITGLTIAGMGVNSMCQHDRVTGCLDIWSNIILCSCRGCLVFQMRMTSESTDRVTQVVLPNVSGPPISWRLERPRKAGPPLERENSSAWLSSNQDIDFFPAFRLKPKHQLFLGPEAASLQPEPMASALQVLRHLDSCRNWTTRPTKRDQLANSTLPADLGTYQTPKFHEPAADNKSIDG